MSSKVTKVEEITMGGIRDERVMEHEKQLETVGKSEKELPGVVKCPFGRGRIVDIYV